MASTTKRFSITGAWQDIAEGAADVVIQHRDSGDVEIFYGAAPTAADIGVVINGHDGTGSELGIFKFNSVGGMFARTQVGRTLVITVMQGEAVTP